ncbi:hypothetical protein [Paraburkholderia sediminicola]|uniref:hypothetical protein n=1 Tax=Paraburkholderia sediminicola TaxID=458836 RepID=UPI0038BC0212
MNMLTQFKRVVLASSLLSCLMPGVGAWACNQSVKPEDCHVTINCQNGESISLHKSENGHGETAEGHITRERLERALRIDTSKTVFGGENALIPHAVEQLHHLFRR